MTLTVYRVGNRPLPHIKNQVSRESKAVPQARSVIVDAFESTGKVAHKSGSQPVLRKGAQGPEVTRVQNLLKAKGFDPGSIDGKFGTNTETAVKQFQEAAGIHVDGVVGPRSWVKLTEAQAPDPVVDPSSASPVLGPGSSGDAVKELQNLLKSRGYACGKADGKFGPKTAGAVKCFQQAAGLDATGTTDDATWSALRTGTRVDGTPMVAPIDTRLGPIAPFEVSPIKATLVKEFPPGKPAGYYKKIGDNYDPDYDGKNLAKSGHHGIDVYATKGTDLVAPFDGKVILVKTDREKGMAVAVERDDGTIVRFTHLDEIESGLKVGMRVEAGTKVGEVGKTGTGSVHLHFSVYRDSYYNSVNPYPFLKAAEAAANP